jgi:hypothetical protein
MYFWNNEKQMANYFCKALELQLDNCVKTIFSACILHNICMLGNDFDQAGLEIYADENEENNNQQDIEDDFLEPDVQEAITFRNNLFDQFFNENHADEE